MLSKDKLLASHWLIAGDTYPGFTDEASPHDFRQRAEVSAEVGFHGMGFVHQELLAIRGPRRLHAGARHPASLRSRPTSRSRS